MYHVSPPRYPVIWLTTPQGRFLELSNTHTFAASDSVEALAFDPMHNRLAVSSHYGHVQMYRLEKNGEG
jgi:hypothetical protein